jgi:putative GTP pyrophosphokinase
VKPPTPGKNDLKLIDSLVQHATDNEKLFTNLLKSLYDTFSSDEELMTHVHSMKWRVKDPDHLREKLIRKWREARENKRKFSMNRDNLFVKVNDLAGFRILHLHTRQFEHIKACLERILAEQLYSVKEGPNARTWDDESRAYFSSINTRFVKSDTLYTSVHYVIAPNHKTKYTCEIQVRTLAEELWGEVDHTINYPQKSKSLSCKEQIKVLARVTSSCSRLVDSIFLSHDDYVQSERAARRNVS